MPPEMNANIPPSIRRVLAHLRTMEDHICQEAADLISAFVAQAEPQAIHTCLNTNTATRGGVTVQLSPNQTAVVHMLARYYPQIVTIDALRTALWGPYQVRSENTVRVMMPALRKRLEPLNVKIHNRHGVGYKLELLPITP